MTEAESIRQIVTEKPWPLTLTEIISAFRSANPSSPWGIDEIGEAVNKLVADGSVVQVHFHSMPFIGSVFIRYDPNTPIRVTHGDKTTIVP